MKQFKQLGRATGFTYQNLWPIIVIVLAFTAYGLWIYLPAGKEKTSSPVTLQQQKQIQQLELAEKEQKAVYKRAAGNYAKRARPVYYTFNPNTATAADWESFGLSPKQAGAIVRYVNKGGTFRRVEDLKKMYTLSAEKYEAIKGYVDIPSAGNSPAAGHNDVYKARTTATPLVIDINTADSAALTKVKGIGPFYAGQIVKLRSQLGALVNTDQLMMLYKMDREKLNAMLPQLKVGAGTKKMININSISLAELKQLPFIKWKEASAIVNYRTQHGPYASAEALKQVTILPAELIAQLNPYLNFN